MRTLISTEELARHLEASAWVPVDCRFNLRDPEAGPSAYRRAHVPGAVHAHLDRDLAGPVTPSSGRHPLPAVEAFRQELSRWGIDPSVQVVAYDDVGGAYAARLWWMLRALGHQDVAVLDGGFARWLREGRPTRAGEERRKSTTFQGAEGWSGTASLEEIEKNPETQAFLLIDARAPERFRGESEPLDLVAGHVPGARNRPFADNLAEDGTFKPPEVLRAEFQALLGTYPPTRVICYCGSGVSACHHLLALAHAGLEGARLYVGSWSQWCADPARPVARTAPSGKGC